MGYIETHPADYEGVISVGLIVIWDILKQDQNLMTAAIDKRLIVIWDILKRGYYEKVLELLND